MTASLLAGSQYIGNKLITIVAHRCPFYPMDISQLPFPLDISVSFFPSIGYFPLCIACSPLFLPLSLQLRCLSPLNLVIALNLASQFLLFQPSWLYHTLVRFSIFDFSLCFLFFFPLVKEKRIALCQRLEFKESLVE